MFGVGRIRDVISRRSKTDHYRCPLRSLLFKGGRELSLESNRFPEILIERGVDREGYFGPGLRLLVVASGFVL